MLDLALLNRAASLIGQSQNILLITHEKPDGDAIGSLLAMQQIIQCLKGEQTIVHAVCCDNVPEAFQFLPQSQEVARDFIGGDADLMVILDCGDIKRTGFADRIHAIASHGVPIINIDHHPKNDLHRIAAVNIHDSGAAATTQILYAMCDHLEVPLTPSLATNLFTGLYTDTGSFQHPVTTSGVFHIAANLLAKGARQKEVRKYLANTKPIPMLKLWGIALSRAKLRPNGVVTSCITQSDMRQTGAHEDDVAGIVTMLEAVHHCRVALLLCETADGQIKGSLRSNNSRIDVSALARVFGGGGHARAAGFVLTRTLSVDKDQITIV